MKHDRLNPNEPVQAQKKKQNVTGEASPLPICCEVTHKPDDPIVSFRKGRFHNPGGLFMSVHTPFRHWRINGVLSAGVGWTALGAGGALYTIEAEDDSHVVPPMSGEITEYDIPQPTATRAVRRERVPESPSSEVVYQQPRLQGLSLPRLIRRFSVNCLSFGVGFDITDVFAIPSGNISLPCLPSTGPERVSLVAVSRASAADLTGFGGILEIGASFGAGVSVQVIFLGTTPIIGTRTSDGVDLDRASLDQAGALSSVDHLVRFLTQALLPHGVAIMGGMNIGIGEMGISFHHAVLRAQAVGSTVRTVDLRDI